MTASTPAAFVSYSREDSGFALRLAGELKAAGVVVWLDQLAIKPGHRWDDAVGVALTGAQQVIVILSPASVKSENVLDEISFGLDHGKTIVPVLYKDCVKPVRIQRIQHIDFRTDHAAGLATLLSHLNAEQSDGGANQIWRKGQGHPSRRRFILGSALLGCAAAGGVTWKWNQLYDMFHPLPSKRYVALMAWPAPTDEARPTLTTVLGSVYGRLAQAESYVSNLLIISSSDFSINRPTVATPADSVATLGANLVLTASLEKLPNTLALLLQVLDATTQEVLRSRQISTSIAEAASLAEKGSVEAARLLSLPQQDASGKEPDPFAGISAQAFSSFSKAEQFAAEPNNTGIDAEIENYSECLNQAPQFQLAYAKLAIAYTVKYRLVRDSALLTLARQNADKASSVSAAGLLSKALAYLYSGDAKDATDYLSRTLKADPGNPDTLLYRAQVLRDAHQWAEAEQMYLDILKIRPNYWPANNELGWIHYHQAEYQKAADAFDAAALSAPSVALPLANLGVMYEALQRPDDALDAAKRSIARSPNRIAFSTIGDIAFSNRDYSGALTAYQNAAKQDPRYHLVWRDIGDCYAMLGQPAQMRDSYAKAANLLQGVLKDNPNPGPLWMTLAFYEAKIGNSASAEADMQNAEQRGADDVISQFMKVQALAVLGKKEEATELLLACMKRGLSPVEVDLAIDLKGIEKDPRYIAQISVKKSSASGPA
ncbi:MAG: TIR domain-containing protein [Acidobacteriaceae bacterium]